MNKAMDAIYILSPLPHIVDCLMADLERRRYRKAFLIWTSGSSVFKNRELGIRDTDAKKRLLDSTPTGSARKIGSVSNGSRSNRTVEGPKH